MASSELVLHWAIQGSLVLSYAAFRSAYGTAACAARSPSYLTSLGFVPEGATQEVDILLVTLILSGQRWKRATNGVEFASTLIAYLQLAVGALLALTDVRAFTGYCAHFIGAWILSPVPPLPLRQLGLSIMTPYELAAMSTKDVRASGSFVKGTSAQRKSAAVVVAASNRSDEAALSASEALSRDPSTQLWYADLGAYPEMADGLQVDSSLMSLELPSVLLIKPTSDGKAVKRLPLKGEADAPGGQARVQTVKLDAANIRRYFTAIE